MLVETAPQGGRPDPGSEEQLGGPQRTVAAIITWNDCGGGWATGPPPRPPSAAKGRVRQCPRLRVRTPACCPSTSSARSSLASYGTSPDGRLFRTARAAAERHRMGRSLAARPPRVLTPAQQASPLARRRPYASATPPCGCGSTPRPCHRGRPPAGHGVAVLLKVYANCIEGQATAANQRISDTPDGT